MPKIIFQQKSLCSLPHVPIFLLSSVIGRDPLTCELSNVVLSPGTRETASHNAVDFAAWTPSPRGGRRMALNSRWPLPLDKCFRSSYGKGKWSQECLGGFSSEPNNLTMSMVSIFKSPGPLVPWKQFQNHSILPCLRAERHYGNRLFTQVCQFSGSGGRGHVLSVRVFYCFTLTLGPFCFLPAASRSVD